MVAGLGSFSSGPSSKQSSPHALWPVWLSVCSELSGSRSVNPEWAWLPDVLHSSPFCFCLFNCLMVIEGRWG